MISQLFHTFHLLPCYTLKEIFKYEKNESFEPPGNCSIFLNFDNFVFNHLDSFFLVFLKWICFSKFNWALFRVAIGKPLILSEMLLNSWTKVMNMANMIWVAILTANPFVPNVPFIPWKHKKIVRFSDVFRV